MLPRASYRDELVFQANVSERTVKFEADEMSCCSDAVNESSDECGTAYAQSWSPRGQVLVLEDHRG